MTRLTIDQKEVHVPEGTTILEAAAQAGIRIPTLCYHEKLLPFGACRICVVEVDADERTAYPVVLHTGHRRHGRAHQQRADYHGPQNRA